MSSPQIFLSYSRDDVALMQRIRDDLHQEGFKVWTDEAIQPGSPSWKIEIEEAIRQSDCLLVIFSPDAAESRWVRAEIDFAETLKKPLYSVLARGDKTNAVPFGMTTHQWIDLRDLSRYASGMTLLKQSMRKQLGAPQKPVSGEEATPPTRRSETFAQHRLSRRVIATLVLLLIAFGAVATWWVTGQQSNASLMIPAEAGEWVERRVGSIRLSIPANWNNDLDPSLAVDILNQSAGNEEVAAAFQSAIPLDFPLFVGDWSNLVMLGVMEQELPMRLSLTTLQQRSTQLFEMVNAEVVEYATLEFPAGEMLRLVTRSRSPELSGGNIAYYLLNDNRVYYSIFFIGDTENYEARVAELMPLSEQIMQTFRLDSAPAS
jgi:hypothetical protein